MFYRKALSSSRPKEVWKTINRILKPNKTTINHDPETLNKHFNTVAEKLTNRKSQTNADLHTIIDNMQNQENVGFVMRPTTYKEVKEALNKIRNDCSAGNDNIPINLLKPVSDKIISPLTYIINGFINQGTFPEEWKIARISPIPKIAAPSKASDYRPISVLPVLSKVYERVILQQLVIHIETLYQSTQHGFRKSRSTLTCLLKLKDDILKAMEKGEVTVAVFADYSKAFDTIDYSILIRKMRQLNFSKSFLHWITEYLTNRKHYVQIDDKSSPLLNASFGVPQGSILGPILFNLYVTDMPHYLQTSGSLQYADDTTLYSHCRPIQLEQETIKLTNNLINLKNWSSDANLVFNNKKTKTMLFTTKQLSRAHGINNIENKVSCDGQQLDSTDNLKILGITFNQHLEWKNHINTIIKSCYSTLKALKLLKRLIPFNLKKQLVTMLVLSKLDYGSSVYMGTTPLYLIKRLQKVQNAAAGFVYGRHATMNDVINLSWLPVVERFEYSISVLAFKAINDINAPSNLKVERREDARTLRSNNINTGTTLKCNDKVNTFQLEAKRIFNSLPKSTRDCLNIHTFKKETKTFLHDKALARYLSSMS